MSDETVDPIVVPAEPTQAPAPVTEGKPVGPATIVEDAPEEQFPANDEATS